MKDTMMKSRPMVFNRFDKNTRDVRFGFIVIGSNMILKMQEK